MVVEAIDDDGEDVGVVLAGRAEDAAAAGTLCLLG